MAITLNTEHLNISTSVFDSVNSLVSCSHYILNRRNYLQLQIKAMIWVVISDGI